MAKRVKALKVGDRVTVQLGTHSMKARIIEDRGRIGKDGRQIVRIQRSGGIDAPDQIYEVPAEELVTG